MKTKSFTLIELLVVIVIIGILSGVIVISVTNYINDAKNTKIVAELSNLSKSFEGYSNYYVGSLCIEDTANNAAFLSYYGLSSYPKHPNYTAGSTSLTTNDCYLYFSDGTNYSIRTPSVGNKGYLIQESRTQKTKPIEKNCETGWIPFGNRCVMQYEARAKSDADSTIDADGLYVTLSSNSPTSTGSGLPWRSITQIDAKAECESIGAHLITNAEWMAIARDIESVSSNWAGVVLNRGHTDNVPASALAASTDSDPYSGTGQTTGEQKRTHTLSNGEVIWDFAGNVRDWVDDKVSCFVDVCPSTLTPRPTGWQNYTAITSWGKYSRAELGVFGSFTGTTNGVGKFLSDVDSASGSSDTYTHAFLRGGAWNSLSNGGVFTCDLDYSPFGTISNSGFRCVK